MTKSTYEILEEITLAIIKKAKKDALNEKLDRMFPNDPPHNEDPDECLKKLDDWLNSTKSK